MAIGGCLGHAPVHKDSSFLHVYMNFTKELKSDSGSLFKEADPIAGSVAGAGRHECAQ